MKQIDIDRVVEAVCEYLTVPDVFTLIEAVEDAPNVLVQTIENLIGDAGFFREPPK